MRPWPRACMAGPRGASSGSWPRCWCWCPRRWRWWFGSPSRAYAARRPLDARLGRGRAKVTGGRRPRRRRHAPSRAALAGAAHRRHKLLHQEFALRYGTRHSSRRQRRIEGGLGSDAPVAAGPPQHPHLSRAEPVHRAAPALGRAGTGCRRASPRQLARTWGRRYDSAVRCLQYAGTGSRPSAG